MAGRLRRDGRLPRRRRQRRRLLLGFQHPLEIRQDLFGRGAVIDQTPGSIPANVGIFMGEILAALLHQIVQPNERYSVWKFQNVHADDTAEVGQDSLDPVAGFGSRAALQCVQKHRRDRWPEIGQLLGRVLANLEVVAAEIRDPSFRLPRIVRRRRRCSGM